MSKWSAELINTPLVLQLSYVDHTGYLRCVFAVVKVSYLRRHNPACVYERTCAHYRCVFVDSRWSRGLSQLTITWRRRQRLTWLLRQWVRRIQRLVTRSRPVTSHIRDQHQQSVTGWHRPLVRLTTTSSSLIGGHTTMEWILRTLRRQTNLRRLSVRKLLCHYENVLQNRKYIQWQTSNLPSTTSTKQEIRDNICTKIVK